MSHSLRIVVADSEQGMQRYFRTILRDMGHEITGVADSGEKLIECCQTLQPELVLGECELPDMSGIEAARRVNVQQSVPFVLLCRFDHVELVEAAHCPIVHLLKPAGQAEIAAAIRKALSMRVRHLEE